MNFRKIEKNGLVIISFAAALLYWYFDSLHPGELISRVFTSFLFISYGFFTQYLINSNVEQRNIEAKYHDLLDHINDGIYRLNKDGYFTFANKVIMDSTGIPLGKLYDYHYLDIVTPEDHETARKNFEKVMKGEEAVTHELKYKTADGDLMVMEINTTPIHGQREIVGIQSISRDITERKRGEVALQQEHAELEQRVVERTEELRRINEELQKDITERKQAEEKIRASLREKEILLREIHHRVKNNLQVISGLLHLQAKASKNPEVIENFQESQKRIRAMALIHEKLYETKDFSRIDLAGYVRSLSAELFQSYKINSGKIDLTIQTNGEVHVDIIKAIPCGLIMNELISNVLKYAFPGDRKGELQIIIGKAKDAEIAIVVRDNGVGLPDNLEIHEPQSLGLDLVNGLVTSQLDGQIEVKRDNGTEFRISFPL